MNIYHHEGRETLLPGCKHYCDFCKDIPYERLLYTIKHEIAELEKDDQYATANVLRRVLNEGKRT